ncbi:hypothetical protein LCH21_05065 [Patescibacteria group bacterium]|nr:hypothetical protein [Patescibacteria group bacterium]
MLILLAPSLLDFVFVHSL